MSRKINVLIGMCLVIMITDTRSYAQNIDEDRMLRDLKVSENVLVTLIKQKFEDRRMFFPLAVSSSYQDGYGVTFTLPADYTTPIVFSIQSDDQVTWGADWNNSGEYRPRGQTQEVRVAKGSWALKDNQQRNLDSIRDASNDRLIEAAKEFLADYGDILSQVRNNERIVITNQGDQPRMWVGSLVNAPSRSHLSIEMAKADHNQFKQNKITRDQLMDKIKVMNAESIDAVEPDLELLSTIFNRLYRPDLSKTFFTEGNIYYERLKDYGAVFYMQVFSSNRTFGELYDMPTVGMHEVGQEERDKKVKELYPQFEKELKENIIEYGRTLKSLKDDESLIFNVRVTQCIKCKIPSTLEMTVKGSMLKDYNAGKINRESALGKVVVKKGQDQ